MRKLAVIRNNDQNPCPFGLEVPIACRTVGGLVYQMTSILHMLPKDYSEQDKQDIIEANQHLFVWGGDKGHCPYARKFITEDKKAIECNFEDNTKDVPISPPVSYLDSYLGLGPGGMYAIPLGMFGFNSSWQYGGGGWNYADDGKLEKDDKEKE